MAWASGEWVRERARVVVRYAVHVGISLDGFPRGNRKGGKREARMMSKRGEQGQALVELAVVLTILIIIALGGSDFARGIGEYQQVVNAANAGAQYAATGTSESTNQNCIYGAAQSELGWTGSGCDPSANSSLCPVSPNCITFTAPADDGTGEGVKKVSVTVTLNYNMNMPFVGYFVNPIKLSSTATMRVNPFNS